MDEIYRMTFAEYLLLMDAAQLKWVDTDYRIHQAAFLNFAATAKKKKGKKEVPVYTRFAKFYNHEAEENRVRNQKSKGDRFSSVKEYLKKKGGT